MVQSLEDQENFRLDEVGTLAEQVADIVTKVGTMLIRAGAEVYRVEQTMSLFGESIPGVKECVSYVTTTGIMCSVVTEHHMATRISRVSGGDRNLEIINAVNALSREAVKKHFTIDEIVDRLVKIENLPKYSEKMTLLFGTIGAAGFAVFFGGNTWVIVASIVLACLIQMIAILFRDVKLDTFIVLAIQSFVTAAGAELIFHLTGLTDPNTVIISVIMLLVPGLTITNGLRDTMMGDYLSGLARFSEALVIAGAIAVGCGVGVAIMM